MCQIFASQPAESYAFETRSIRLNGQSTSIRLERIFWDMLDIIARDHGFASVPRFISTLHSEVLALRGEAPNFTSHLRCVCLVAMERGVTRIPVDQSQAA
jgi:predicted DNA-binding ribbon-helix-helix protein